MKRAALIHLHYSQIRLGQEAMSARRFSFLNWLLSPRAKWETLQLFWECQSWSAPIAQPWHFHIPPLPWFIIRMDLEYIEYITISWFVAFKFHPNTRNLHFQRTFKANSLSSVWFSSSPPFSAVHGCGSRCTSLTSKHGEAKQNATVHWTLYHQLHHPCGKCKRGGTREP